MIQSFPVYDIEGNAYECGLSHGEQAAERVARTLEIYLPAFTRQVKLALTEIRERARQYAAAIKDLDLEIMEELEGIAAGSRQKVEDIVAVNCRTEILYGSLAGTKPATECTTIVALPEATRDGGMLVGKNWDWRNACVGSIVVLKIRQSGKPALTLIVEAGMVGRDALNEDGIIHIAPGQPCQSDYMRVTLPGDDARQQIAPRGRMPAQRA